MSDGIRQVNNPQRVPSTLTAIDGPQEGEPRVIHPITILVGRHDRTQTTMNTYVNADPQYFEVPEDGTFQNDQGDPFQYAKGDRLPLSVAVRFPDFRDHIDDAEAGLQLARPVGEVPDVGPAEKRAMASAPENRMEPAPENRAGMFVAEEDLTPAQKAARTRAANKAKEEADATSQASGTNDEGDVSTGEPDGAGTGEPEASTS